MHLRKHLRAILGFQRCDQHPKGRKRNTQIFTHSDENLKIHFLHCLEFEIHMYHMLQQIEFIKNVSTHFEKYVSILHLRIHSSKIGIWMHPFKGHNHISFSIILHLKSTLKHEIPSQKFRFNILSIISQFTLHFWSN